MSSTTPLLSVHSHSSNTGNYSGPIFPRQQLTLTDRIVKSITRPIFYLALYRTALPSCIFKPLTRLMGFDEIIQRCKEFLRDIGGEEIRIDSEGASLSAMYFNAELFKGKEPEIFNKWKTFLSQPENRAVANWLGANLEGKNLRELMNLPQAVEVDCSSQAKGVARCLGAGNLFEVAPQDILQHLYRGIDHLSFNYSGHQGSTGSVGYEETCTDAYYATLWLKNKKNCENSELCISGVSLGGGPAFFAATQLPGLNVVGDRTFSALNNIHFKNHPKIDRYVMPIFRNLAKKFYPYPNNQWIQSVEGRVLVLQARLDSLITSEHSDDLMNHYLKNPKFETALSNVDPTSRQPFIREKSFVEVSGGHETITDATTGEVINTWIADNDSQEAYTAFLLGHKG